MNRNITKLFEIAQKQERIILGLMSGTSLDGLDIALCKFKNSGKNTRIELLHHTTYPYSDAIKIKIQEVFSKDVVKLQHVCLMNSRLANVHTRMILATLEQWGIPTSDIDCIASHGQTIYHAPKRLHLKPNFTNSTFQIGDGDHIAYKTGVITISDFRQKHVAAGGEGAPLVAYGDYLLYSSEEENRVLLNIGGIANFTYLPISQKREEVFATDTGAGNCLIDTVVRRYLPPMLFDDEGQIAASGTVNEILLKTLKSHPFFLQSYPKTTGAELFNLQFIQEAQKNSDTLWLNTDDLVATLTRFSAETISDAILSTIPQHEEYQIYLSGGGANNTTLIDWLKELMPQAKFVDFKKLGIPPDMKEAVLFALLANETLSGEGFSLGKDDKAMPSILMGKISLPN